MACSFSNNASFMSFPITATREPERLSELEKNRPLSISAVEIKAYSLVVPVTRTPEISSSPRLTDVYHSETGATYFAYWDRSRRRSACFILMLGRFRISHHSLSPNHSNFLIYKTSFPKNSILCSNERSNPEISVPISVTARIPITTPSAVKRDRILLARTAVKEMRKFSRKRESIMQQQRYRLSLSHQTGEWFCWRVRRYNLHG